MSAAFGLFAWTLAGVGLLPVEALGDSHWYGHVRVWAEILGVGATATAGQVCLTLAYSRGVATRVAVVGLSQVVMVMAGETLFGWKELTPVMLGGTAMVLGPTAWLMLRDRRRAAELPVTLPAVTVTRGDDLHTTPGEL